MEDDAPPGLHVYPFAGGPKPWRRRPCDGSISASLGGAGRAMARRPWGRLAWVRRRPCEDGRADGACSPSPAYPLGVRARDNNRAVWTSISLDKHPPPPRPSAYKEARAGIRGMRDYGATPAANFPALEICWPSSKKIMNSYPPTLHGVYRYRSLGGKRGTLRAHADEAMQDPGYHLPRSHLLGSRVNKGKKKDRSCYAPALGPCLLRNSHATASQPSSRYPTWRVNRGRLGPSPTGC